MSKLNALIKFLYGEIKIDFYLFGKKILDLLKFKHNNSHVWNFEEEILRTLRI